MDIEQAVANRNAEADVRKLMHSADIWFISTVPTVDVDDDGVTWFAPLIQGVDSEHGVERAAFVFTSEGHGLGFLEAGLVNYEGPLYVLPLKGDVMLHTSNCAIMINYGFYVEPYRLLNCRLDRAFESEQS
jgi:hypothetical protein